MSTLDAELDEALDRIYQRYGNNLAAFFDDARRTAKQTKQRSRAMEYQVIRADFLGDLLNDVQEAIAQSWQPQGGICVVRCGENKLGEADHFYYQAMIRINDEPAKS